MVARTLEARASRRRSHPIRKALRLLIALAVLLLGAFAVNGLSFANGIVPLVGEETGIAPSVPSTTQVKVLAWNLNKCGVHRGGLVFAEPEEVRARIARIAGVIRAENPDLVFLSEIVKECGFCNVDQVRELARACGMTHWLFGENYNFGLPFLRLVGGNAILAKRPLTAVANPDLVGRRPFWITTNNRRVLFGSAEIGGRTILLAALHLDSFDAGNNLRQMAQVAVFELGMPLLAAGDFNAEPDSKTLKLILDSGRVAGAVTGPPTYPQDAPNQRLDYVLGPSDWKLIDSRVLDDHASDHRAVVSTFAFGQ
ncbi:MAG: endonuclease/exonuclease/phosphatase family protein [Planctomycetota bacterium]